MMSGGLITLSASVEYTVEQARGVLHADRSVPRTIPSHLTMTGQIADQFAQRKIVADEFLEGTAERDLHCLIPSQSI